MKARLWYMAKAYLLTVMLFIIAKVVFMLCYHASQDYSFADMLQVVWHGLSLDLSTALYFIILPWLLIIVSFWMPVKSIILTCYYALIAFTLALAFTADTSLYAFWSFKLDATGLDYLSTPTEAMASVTTGYLILRLLIVILLTIGITLLYNRCCRMPHDKKVSRPWMSLVLFVISIPLIIIGIRGGLNESTTNIGQVYFSEKQFLNHSAVNPVFSFFSSLEDTANHIPDYEFADDQQCQQTIAELYPTESVDSDTLLNTTRPNIVIILMESCGEVFASVMPHLQALKKEGVDFTQCYANSWRTDRGTLCTWSGFPSFPTSSVMKMPAKSRQLPSIASSLLQEGYHTSYLYGGDINFTNMRSYLLGTGFQRLHWLTDYSQEEQNSAKWGVRDDITFNTLYDMITHEQAPFLIGYSTLSTHEPWDVPTHTLDDEVENAFNYLDGCLNNLVKRLKKTPQWKNLLIVLLPDHSMDHNGAGEYLIQRNLIPMVWIGGAVKSPKAISVVCNQTDLPATLLGQLQLPHQQFKYSRDVVSKNYTQPFAVHTFNNAISVVDSTGMVVFDLNTQKIAYQTTADGPQLLFRGQMVLHAAAHDINHMNQVDKP